MHETTMRAPGAMGRRAPGPGGWPGLTALRNFRDDPLGQLELAVRSHGDVVQVPTFFNFYMVAHPDGVKHVLQDNHVNYRKGPDYRRMEPLVGHGLLTSNGEVWKQHRRLAQPAFHRQQLAGFGDSMVRRTQQTLERWRALGDGAVVDVHAEMMRLTLEVVGDILFSMDLGGEAGRVGPAMHEALKATHVRLNSLLPLPLWVPTPFNLNFKRHLGVLDEVVGGIIRERRVHPRSGDLLGMLMEARDESGASALSDDELRDEVMTLVLAGHETTANALTFSLLLLTRHEEVRARLEQSVAQALEGREPAASDAPALSYVKQVAEEAMRLYPPAWAMGREAIDEDEVLGYRIPKGALVMVAPWLTHRDPRFWEDPLRFDPSRFAPDAAPRHRFAYFPFGGGPRLCIGMGLAMMELQLILATLAQAVRVEVLNPEAVELEPLITLRPKGGLPARIRFKT